MPTSKGLTARFRRAAVAVAVALALPVLATACTTAPDAPEIEAAEARPQYVIGPSDELDIFVWRSPELSIAVPVRPDGRISIPLVHDMEAAGKTPTQLSKDLEQALSEFVQSPLVTVIVTEFGGPYGRQVRIVGEAAEPQSLAYFDDMTVLDAMIAVGGLTDFAAGNQAVLLRRTGEGAGNAGYTKYRVRLDDLLQSGDLSANARLLPGDVIVVPESWF